MRKQINQLVSIALVTTMLMAVSCTKAPEQSDSSISDTTALSGSEVSGSDTDSGSSGNFNGVTNSSSILDTGNLTSTGSGYEGIKGTGKYNYGEALQKSILFYELQRSGDLPEKVRCNWRGDSGLKDGSDVGLDLTGGYYDAGDNVKFNLPMAYTASILAWSVYEDKDSYKEAGQYEYILGDIKWVTDYLIKCHPEDRVFYYQVGDGNQDHSWWGPAEIVEHQMTRPSYKVTASEPGSTVVAESAAALAVSSIVFQDTDPEYSKLCLKHAESLFAFANDTRSDAGYTASNGFYTSNSGYFDELCWAASWLYLKTNDKKYLQIAEECYPKASQDYCWSVCWDDVHIAAAYLLANITGKDIYKNAVEENLDFWTTGTKSGDKIAYTPKGLAWLDMWGSLRYATTTGFVAAVYSESSLCPSNKTEKYWNFAESMANYALGDTGRSFLIGFGENYPQNPHHRTAQGSYANNMNEPSQARHVLYGALVGGPDQSDGYTDEVSNYTTNEVACDYNAGFTGLLAKMYKRYHGQTLKDFGAVEKIGDEYSVEAGVNVSGEDFIEIRAFVYNKTAWPARIADKLEMRYFVDLSEVYNKGGSVNSVKISTNYMQGGEVSGLKVWNEEKHIYYLSVVFNDGNLYPGGQEHYKNEIQVRIQNPGGPWDNTNDPSYSSLNQSSGQVGPASGIVLMENDKIVWGNEPDSKASANSGKEPAGQETNSSAEASESTTTATSNSPAFSSGDVSLSVKYDSSGNAIAGMMEIKNTSGKTISLSDFKIEYYLSEDGLTFDCYYAAINEPNGQNTGLSGVTGSFSSISKGSAKTLCTISFPSKDLPKDSTLQVNFSIHRNDWQQMNPGSDYSYSSPNNIVIKKSGKVIFGTEPK